MRAIAGLLFASGLAAVVPAQDHGDCPMAGSDHHRAGVNHRHDEATGVPHEGTVHHFLLSGDGGSIRLEVNDKSQLAARDRIREHLQVVARSFATGDFSLPMRIHDQVPPGVEVMKQSKAKVQYAYSPSESGGLVWIRSRDPKVVEAIHAFLQFQIRDHGTNDPTE